MSPQETKKIQGRLGVSVDGSLGPKTLKALFVRAGAGPERAAELALSANIHFNTYEILCNPLRLAHFMAQMAHESGGFKWMEEFASGEAYEGRADLGNTQSGDGRRYKGRGPIQLTGRSNYRRIGQKIGIDLESHPEIAALPSVGILTACLYWDEHGLNDLADADNVKEITREINGGFNGFNDRLQRLKIMKELLL